MPLYRAFDYRLMPGMEARPGARVRVPFATRELIGVVILALDTQAAEREYKPVLQVLDEAPLLPPALLGLCHWIADYYQQPLGEVFAAALPAPLRRGAPLRRPRARLLRITAAGQAALAGLRAPKQAAVLRLLAEAPRSRALLLETLPAAAAALPRLRARGWVEEIEAPAALVQCEAPPPLSAEQSAALSAWRAAPPGFGVTLLQGVTGSGKTELYLRAVAQVLDEGCQALVLVPEIGLTPQALQRFRARFGEGVAGFHSGLTEAQRAQVWTAAREGDVRVLVGTRSAVFVPLPRLGLVIVDEEHDGSFKQQEGLLYSAREAAMVRARAAGARVMLGSATPSMETLANVQRGRYRVLHLRERIHTRSTPRIQLLDIRARALRHGLAPALIEAMRRHLDDGGQVLLFINRRGYAPALLCHDCAWVVPCAHCDARMTLHRAEHGLLCHHCGARRRPPKACARCGSLRLVPVGQGTERLEEALRALFPEHRCERFDSDRMRRAGELERLLEDARRGDVRILVGTQMLAKGHDFPNLSLVGILSADQALYSSDFRALERMGQLLTQVAGRAGRAERAGEVLLQTHEPEHPLLRRLVEQGFEAFAQALLGDRQAMGLPPYGYLALLRAEAVQRGPAQRFLDRARSCFQSERVEVLGPVAAPMERRAGRLRAQLLLRAARRAELQAALHRRIPEIAELPEARRLRWSIDVDPVDLF